MKMFLPLGCNGLTYDSARRSTITETGDSDSLQQKPKISLSIEMRVNGMLKCQHFRSPQVKLGNAHHTTAPTPRERGPAKSQAVKHILALDMITQKTPSCSPSMPRGFPNSSSFAFLSKRQKPGMTGPLQVADFLQSRQGLKLSFSST